MAHTPKILAFSGSLRADSFNQRLVALAASAARRAGAEVTLISLRDFPMPLFDEDLEKKGTPDAARKFKDLMIAHDGLLISSPEYNSSLSAALKNALDWASRPAPAEVPLVAFNGKVAGLLAASPGALGGLRGLVHLRAILGNINVLLLPEQFALSKAHEAFNSDGTLKDAKQQSVVDRIALTVCDTVRKLRSA